VPGKVYVRLENVKIKNQI